MRPVDACLLDGPRMVGTGANFTQIWVYSSSVVWFCARVALCRAMNDEKGRVQYVIPDDAATRQMELCFKTRNRLLSLRYRSRLPQVQWDVVGAYVRQRAVALSRRPTVCQGFGVAKY